MKFKKKIAVCRHDEEVPLKVLMRYFSLICGRNIKGKCEFDGRKCKIIEYERVKK